MKIEIDINEKYTDPKIVICTNKLTEELNNIIEKINQKDTKGVYGFKEERMYLLEDDDIETIFTEDKKVYIRKQNGEIYESKKRIYELEEMMPVHFVRISNSEIVNFTKVENLDFKITGTIILNFCSGKSSYVSRRFIKRIKEYLGI